MKSLELDKIDFFPYKKNPLLTTINRHMKNYKQIQFYVLRP